MRAQQEPRWSWNERPFARDGAAAADLAAVSTKRTLLPPFKGKNLARGALRRHTKSADGNDPGDCPERRG
jgi:hypothetical protein